MCVDYLKEYPILFAVFALVLVALGALLYVLLKSDGGSSKPKGKKKKAKSASSASGTPKTPKTKKEKSS